MREVSVTLLNCSDLYRLAFSSSFSIDKSYKRYIEQTLHRRIRALGDDSYSINGINNCVKEIFIKKLIYVIKNNHNRKELPEILLKLIFHTSVLYWPSSSLSL